MPTRPRRGAAVSQNYDAQMWDVLDDLRRSAVTKANGATVRNNTLTIPELPRTISKGGGGGVPVRITGIHPDSPTGESSVYIFRGDAYAKGSEAAASTEDITIRIMGLAAGVAEYPTGPGIATPINQSWTNAISVVVTEIVYELDPFTWWGVL